MECWTALSLARERIYIYMYRRGCERLMDTTRMVIATSHERWCTAKLMTFEFREAFAHENGKTR